MSAVAEEELRKIKTDLLSTVPVDVNGDEDSDSVVQRIHDWAIAVKATRSAHLKLGGTLRAQCVDLQNDLQGIMDALSLSPKDMDEDAKRTAVAEALMSLVCDESHTWDPQTLHASSSTSTAAGTNDSAAAKGESSAVEGDGAPGADNSKHSEVFTYSTNSRGVLKLRLANAGQNLIAQFKTKPAYIELKIHRAYTCEDGTVEKLPVTYQVSVGQSPLKRAFMGGVLLALFRADSAAARTDHGDYLFSKELSVEDEHCYMLNANPGDTFVVSVSVAEGSAPLTLHTSFLDMKLAGAVEHLVEAAGRYEDHTVQDLDSLVARVEALHKASQEQTAHLVSIAEQESQASELRQQIAAVQNDISSAAETVRAKLSQEASDETWKADLEDQLKAERERLELKLSQAVKQVENEFHMDKEAELATPGTEGLQATRQQRLADEAAVHSSRLAELEQSLQQEVATLEQLKESKKAIVPQLADELAKITAQRQQQHQAQLRDTRARMKRDMFDNAESTVKDVMSESHSELEAAIRARRAVIRNIRNLSRQPDVLKLLQEWDYNDAHKILIPFL